MADLICLGFSLFFFIIAAVTMGSADPNEYRLVRDLLTGYDKRVRPILNHTDALNVTFGLSLVQIIDVDEKNQVLTTNCWLNQIWIDYNLRWDPAKYGGITVLRLPYDEVWKPDILLHNNADVATHVATISSNLVVTHTGNVTWYSMVIFKSSCTIHVRYFPFDEQTCPMDFASWSYDSNQLNLTMNSEEGDLTNYIKNSEWELQNCKVERRVTFYSCCDEPYLFLRIKITIRRRPLFYIFNMFVPCILITLVALLGFYIPSDSGEKVTMGITTLLSMTVFMMLVTESMPPNSEDLPLIGVYYGMTIFIVSFATAMTVFTLNIHHKGQRGKPVPGVVRTICFDYLAKLFCMKVDSFEESHSTLFTMDCNGIPGGSSSYVRFKVATQQETDDINMEMKHVERVELPSDQDSFRESFQTNGTLPRTFNSFRRHNGSGSSPEANGGAHGGGTDKDHFEAYFQRVLQRVHQSLEQNDVRLADQDKRDAIKLEWQQVAQITDRLLLACFVVGTLLLTFVVLLISPASARAYKPSID